jgi:hypothetical protein
MSTCTACFKKQKIKKIEKIKNIKTGSRAEGEKKCSLMASN